MSDLSVQAIKTLNKNELKLELKNRGLDGQGKKEDLVNRLTKAIIEIPSNPDKHECTTESANISVELVKEIFTDMFLKQEQKILDIVQRGAADTNSRIDRLTQEIKDYNTRLDVLRKETDELKLSVEASQEMMEKKFEKAEGKVKSYKLQHDKDINELWQENEYLREKMRDLEDRSRRDNLRVDGLKEIDNETWEKTEEILQQMIRDVLELEGINIERAHRVGNKSNEKNAPRTIVAKFSSYKDKQAILSVAKKLKGKDIYINEDYSKETLEIRKENWQTVKRLRSQGTYAYLVYDRIVTKGKFRKQQNE